MKTEDKAQYVEAYQMAQGAMAELKSAVVNLLLFGPFDGLSNVDIGRSLGIYSGHKGHEGHISRTLLHLLEEEGVVEQISETKKWVISNGGSDS